MKEISLNLKSMQDYRINESYKQLRTNIEFSGEENKIIAITSCTPSEGKSTVSLSTAYSLAEAGKKVLFIDADLRKSVLAGRYKVTGEMKGLTHFLSGQGDLSEILCITNEKGLFVIFAGPVPPNPTELLSGELFKDTLNSFRDIYDYIFIDCAPVGMVIDAAIVAKCSDAAIMMIESGAVKRKLALEAKEKLETAGCPILGVVLNKVERKSRGYYRKYYKKYEKYEEAAKVEG